MIHTQLALLILRILNILNQNQNMTISLTDSVEMDLGAATATSSFERTPVATTTVRPRIGDMPVARIPGDIEIGVIFPIHRKSASSDGCGSIWEQYGMHRTEIALKTVEEINNDPTILPNIRLGIDVRDDCWTERIAMEQVIEFIRNVIGEQTASPTAVPTSACCPYVDKERRLSAGTATSTCRLCLSSSTSSVANNLVAVLGPGSSDVSIAVQNLLQVFRIPQVGYSATTKVLSDKNEFKYYMRLVPSDSWQAAAFIDLVRYFNWSYIAVVYTDGNYGEKGFEEIQKNVEKATGVCIAVAEKIKTLASREAYDRLLYALLRHEPAIKVALCFCEGDTIKRIFEATKRVKKALLKSGVDVYGAGIQWIGSESWSDRRDVVHTVEDIAAGGISFRIYSPRVTSFDAYYFGLTPQNNARNPWFVEFWEQKFSCSLSNETASLYARLCDGSENLTQNYKPDPKLSQVVNSVYTVAYGLDSMYKDVCRGYDGVGPCPAMLPIDGSKLFAYMLKTRFVDAFGQEIYFDNNGDPPARYDILNYHGRTRGYVKVGEWGHKSINVSSSGPPVYEIGLDINSSMIRWFNGRSDVDHRPLATCSAECAIGEVKKIQTMKCCWTCVPCFEGEYLLNEFTCKQCRLGYWPTENRTDCYRLELEFIRWADATAIACAVFAGVGMFATVFTAVVFMRNNATPVVKATTRELSYLILFGLFLCYLNTYVVNSRPNTLGCYVSRVLPAVAFSMVYGALLTKTNRIARILAGSKMIMTRKPRFLSTTSQVIITAMIVGIEVVITVAFLIMEPADAVLDHSLPRRVLLVCATSTLSFLAPFGFDLFLVAMCTLYAVKTRNLPENFNEAKFIGFTMYTTCIIWLAFITIYFGSTNKGIIMNVCFSLSATVALILLFFPKLYVIILRPEKNVRSYFKTAKSIRCHFGRGSGGSRTTSVNFQRSIRRSARNVSFKSNTKERCWAVSVKKQEEKAAKSTEGLFRFGHKYESVLDTKTNSGYTGDDSKGKYYAKGRSSETKSDSHPSITIHETEPFADNGAFVHEETGISEEPTLAKDRWKWDGERLRSCRRKFVDGRSSLRTHPRGSLVETVDLSTARSQLDSDFIFAPTKPRSTSVASCKADKEERKPFISPRSSVCLCHDPAKMFVENAHYRSEAVWKRQKCRPVELNLREFQRSTNPQSATAVIPSFIRRHFSKVSIQPETSNAGAACLKGSNDEISQTMTNADTICSTPHVSGQRGALSYRKSSGPIVLSDSHAVSHLGVSNYLLHAHGRRYSASDFVANSRSEHRQRRMNESTCRQMVSPVSQKRRSLIPVININIEDDQYEAGLPFVAPFSTRSMMTDAPPGGSSRQPESVDNHGRTLEVLPSVGQPPMTATASSSTSDVAISDTFNWSFATFTMHSSPTFV